MVTIRKRIMLLLCVLAGSFLAGAIAWRIQEKRNADLLAEASLRQKIASVEKIVSLHERSLETFTYLYTFWDETIDFVHTRDPKWAAGTLMPVMRPLETDNVWIYDLNWSLVYSANSPKAVPLPQLPLSRSVLERVLGKQHFCHFFVRTRLGLMEIRGGTIHKTADEARVGPYYGYFLAGRLWNSDLLKNLEELTGCRIRLKDWGGLAPSVNRTNGDIRFVENLHNWNNSPLQHLEFVGHIPVIAAIHLSTTRALKLCILFVMALLGLLFLCLLQWISLPLNTIADCLQTERPWQLAGLRAENTEFGELARLITAFFEQKQQLIREIAERKQAQEELSQAQLKLAHAAKLASLGTLSTGVAHELNQPLAVARGIAQQLRAQSGLSEKLRADLELIEQQTTRMIKVVKHLREFCQTGATTSACIDVNQVVYDSFSFIAEQFRAVNICVVIQVWPEPLMVMTNASELEQVVLNMIMNARDVLEGRVDAQIILSTRAQGEQAVIEVRDNGPGIPDELAARIFDPFFTTKEPGRGMGLGLSIGQSIVTKYGGELKVRCDGGAIFTIMLKRV